MQDPFVYLVCGPPPLSLQALCVGSPTGHSRPHCRTADFQDMIDEFVAVWQWKPQGKLTEDELTLKADGILTLKREGQGAAGTWNVAEPKGGGRNLVKIKLSVEPFSSIEMERISLTTLRSTSGPQRAVLKDSLDDCLYVEYFEFPEGLDAAGLLLRN